MKTITVKLPEALATWLARYSRKLGRPQSDVVREALQRLAASGLVVSRGRQGLQVAQLSIADLLDAFSVAAEMEALASAQAARHHPRG